ncbi:hypothetical protein LJC19_07780, partial [Oxalobacter sp. OttesenSCG-928-P03]|nr:hypothetical protein [Oxalobacter sp. OttesenSCG-928-P03]
SILQSFRRHNGGMLEHLLLQKMDGGEDVAMLFGEEKEFAATPRKAKWMHLLQSAGGTEVLDVRAATYGERPVVFADLAIVRPGERGEIYMQNRLMMVYHQGRMLTLTCGAAGRIADRAAIDARQVSNRNTLCQDYFDSLRFFD